jgi:O-antigen/teichoic acid export membrane protein
MDETAPSGDHGVRSSLRWAFLMSSGQRAIGMVATFVLAALLGPHAFGIVSMALVVVIFMQVFVEQGMSTAVVQRGELKRAHLDAAFWMTVVWCLLLAALVVGLSGWWAGVNDQPQLVEVTRVLAILLPIWGLSVVQTAVLQRKMEFKRLALRTSVAAILGAVVGVTLAVLGFGVWSLVAQELSTAVVSLALLWALSGWLPRLRFSRSHARDLLSFSIYAFLGNLGSFLGRRSDILMIGLFMGPTVVGIYRLADRTVDGIVAVTTRPVQLVSLPHFSRLQGDRRALQQAVGSALRLTSITNVPTLLILVACADFLIPLMGDRWAAGATALKLLALVGIAKAVILFTGPVLYAVSRPQIRTAMVWVLAAFSATAFAVVGLSLRHQPTHDQIVGIAGSRAILFVLLFIPVNLAIVARCTGLAVGPLVKPFVVPTLAGLLAVGVVAGLESTGFLDALPGGVALVVAGAAAVLVAGGTLLLLDPEIRARAARLRHRVLSRPRPVQESLGDVI